MERGSSRRDDQLVVFNVNANAATGTLFLTLKGGSFIPEALGFLVSNYVRESGIGKAGSCHMFRHTMATLMLENGADVRFVQAMLGHANLSTTQVYTHVAIRALKEIHTATHPARLERLEPSEGVSQGEQAQAVTRAVPLSLEETMPIRVYRKRAGSQKRW